MRQILQKSNIVERTILDKHLPPHYCQKDREELNVLRFVVLPLRGGFLQIFAELQCPKCKYISEVYII